MKQDLRSFIRNIINEEYELIKSVMYEQTETLQQYITASNQDLTGKSTSGNASLSAQAGIKPPVRQLPANLISKLNADRNSLLQWGNWFTKNQTAIKNSRQSAGWKTIITSQESSMLGKFLKANADALIKPGVGTQIADPTGGLGVGIETTKQSVKWAEIKKGLYDEWAKCYNNTECRTDSIANNIIIAKGNLQGIRLMGSPKPKTARPGIGSLDMNVMPSLFGLIADLLPDKLSWIHSSSEMAYQVAKSITVLGLADYKDDSEWLAVKSILKMRPGDWNIVNEKIKKRTGQGITEYLLTYIFPEGSKDPRSELGNLIEKLMNFLIDYLGKGAGDEDYEKLNNFYINTYATADQKVAHFNKRARWRNMAEKMGMTEQQYAHDLRSTYALAAYLLPGIGTAVATGILAYDTKKYIDEGDKYNAGLNAFFMVLPFVPAIIKKIPAVQYINGKIAANLSKKLATSNWQALNQLDIKIFKETNKYLPFIKSETNNYLRKRLQNQVNMSLRNRNTYRAFINKYGKNGGKIMMLLRYGTPNTILTISKAILPFATFFGSFEIMKSKYDDLWNNNPEWQREYDQSATLQSALNSMDKAVVGDTTIYTQQEYAEEDPFAEK
jgi:hypothetical protein